MINSISSPYWLFLIPIVLAFVWLVPKRKGFKDNFISTLRSITCLLLILAMAGAGVQTYSDKVTTIFAVDVSDSMDKSTEVAKTFIKDAAAHKTDNDYAGVVAFGKNSVVEISPTKEIQLDGFNAYVDKVGTDLEQALATANSIIDSTSQKRVVLISDGKETKGDVLKYTAALKSAQVIVDTVFVDTVIEKEVQISEFNTPSVMNKNTEFQVEVVIHSTGDTSGNVRVFKGSEVAINTEVTLRKGENRFVFTDKVEVGGGIIYRAELSSKDDTLIENNTTYSYTYVEDIPRILIIENQENSGREYSKILEKSQVYVSTVSSAQVPITMEQLNLWDAVILADVTVEALPQEFLVNLETFVRTTGGGLIVTGGENSFALGGYKNTVLEEILPVTMDIETEGEKPDLGMVMVIDHSGSMSDSSYGVSRMEMAKEAAIRAVEVMEEKDSIGVVAFDSTAQWVVQLQKVAGNRGGIIESIGKIQPAGGTSILPALDEAYKVLKDTDTKTKHIILLTDGQAEQNGYEPLMERIKEAGITVSTVAVGGGADTTLLSSLAQMGNGRYYFTNEFTDLPQIFAKETTIAGKEYINNRNFYPTAVEAGQILAGVEAVPNLGGYITTTIKPRSNLVLQSDKEEPILATWQYGIGRTAVWTSDVLGRWTEGWLATQEGVGILKNLASWVMRGGISPEVTFTGEEQEDGAIVTVTMPYDPSVKSVDAVLVSSQGKEIALNLPSEAPGVFSSFAKGISQGGYVVSLNIPKENGETENVRGGFVIDYPREYDMRVSAEGKELLEKISAQTGGVVIETPDQVFRDTQRVVLKTKSITPILIVLAMLFFLFEIATRRISIIVEKLERIFAKKPNSSKKKGDDIKEELKREKTQQPKKEEALKAEKREKVSTAATLAQNMKKRK